MQSSLFESDKFWKWLLLAGIGLFLLTRLLTLTSFPVFNDESIYLQYAQLIHEDFSKYGLISVGANIYNDWKPPFQYWFGSMFMGLSNDPLLAGRLAALAISIFGLWGLYLFVKELFGKREAALAVLLWALCPAVLFFNVQFIAETFVFSLTLWVYWFFLRAIRPDKVRPQYALAAAVFGVLLLLSKQSGTLYLFSAFLLPLAVMDRPGSWREWSWRRFLPRLAVVAGGIAGALLLRRFSLPPEAFVLEAQFSSLFLMGLPEVLRLPFEIWRSNFMTIRDYYFSYYSVFILLPLLYFFFITTRQRDPKKVALALGFLGGSAAILLLLKWFNEYIYNTAVIVFLVPMLVASFFSALEAWRSSAQARSFARIAAGLVLASFGLLAAHWSYQDVLMKISPADYIRRSTPAAMGAYLNNWPGGFGILETAEYIKAQEPPVLVVADPQWGNPRTSLEVYLRGLSNIIMIIMTGEFNTETGAQAAKEYILAQKDIKTRLIVFSGFRNDLRATWQDPVLKVFCDNRKEIQIDRDQPPIIICSF